MLRYLTLDNILMHCRLDEGTEDDYIIGLGETAERMVEDYTNRTLEDLAGEAGVLPRPVEHACYLIIADLYRNREATSSVQQYGGYALPAMLKHYKKLTQ